MTGGCVLTALRLENIALIERLELDFSSGFTVLTGETGAGKSILLDALDALLGGAQAGGSARLLRQGASRASIEACFSLSDPLVQWLQAEDLPLEEGEVVLAREWRCTEGRLSSRNRLNGVTINRAQVQALRPLLVDLTVQGQTQQLARAGQQRRWLDRFGGPPLHQALEGAGAAWREWTVAAGALEQARSAWDAQQQRRHGEELLLAELEAADLEDPHEAARLQQEQDRLAHGVRLQEGVMLLLGRLVEGAEGAPSVLDHLAACAPEWQAMEQCDGSLAALHGQAAEVLEQVQHLVRDLDRYGSSLESDPERLAELQERMQQLKLLQRRHGQDLAGLIDRRDRLREQLAPGAGPASLEDLEHRELAARRRRDAAQAELTALRREAGTRLEHQLMEALRPMGLANVRFAVAIEPTAPVEEGADAVQFRFSANPGQPLAPLAEVASGGEMSRFLLALKTCLAAADGHVTLLFDEIDAGVSGRVSGAMAGLLQRLARQRQVFCITHQPLVAAAADHHFRVSKQVVEGVTHTRVSHLRDSRARQLELAELAGGDHQEARSYAASLLELGSGAAGADATAATP